jgi:hypothetical protein
MLSATPWCSPFLNSLFLTCLTAEKEVYVPVRNTSLQFDGSYNIPLRHFIPSELFLLY